MATSRDRFEFIFFLDPKNQSPQAIGVSNFNGNQIQALYDQAEIKPSNLQVALS